MELSYLILGGNIEDRMYYLRQSANLLKCRAGRIVAQSSVYESEPWGFDNPSLFLNIVVALETELAPLTLLDCIQEIETALDRTRSDARYSARTADIDILFYGAHVLNLPRLTVPHPRIADRMFVLQPLAEIAPNLVHPVMNCSVDALVERCLDCKQVRKFMPQPSEVQR